MADIEKKTNDPVEPQDELSEEQQEELAGGLNPQPLPPCRIQH